MQHETEVHVALSPEIEELLLDNEVDLCDLLRSEGIDVELASPTRVAASEEGTKEPVTVLLAASGLVVALTPTLSKLIGALARRPVLVEERLPVAIEDSHGNVVRDAQGAPVVEWVSRSRFVEPEQLSQETTSLSIEGPIGLSIKYASGEGGGAESEE